ncbi:MAG TPA: hypothetical protein PLF26_17940 [Blastocatellia bacterium]|nr:hypothetical protein [Blastocatellia bacterium]
MPKSPNRRSPSQSRLPYERPPATTPLSRQPLLAFPVSGEPIAGVDREDAGWLKVTFGAASQNVLVVGGTGSGKTESVMRPALARLIETGCAGLVLDTKSDYSALAAGYADRIVLVGTCPGAQRVNVLAGMADERFRQWVSSLSEGLTSTSNNGSYYAQQGEEAAYTIWLCLKYGLGQPPTLARLHKYLTDPRALCQALAARGEAGFPAPLRAQIDAERANSFSLLRFGGYFELNDTMADLSGRGPEQWSWSTNYLRNVLRPFAADPVLRAQLSADTELPISTLVYGLSRTIVLDVPQAVYGTAATAVSQLLRLQFMDAVRTSDPSRRRELGYGRDRFTFLLADEYQEHISASNRDPLGDASFFATSRSYGNINLVATQSISGLEARGDAAAVEGLVGNCRTKVVLTVEDPRTIDLACSLVPGFGLKVIVHLRYPERAGQGFVHTRNEGRVVAGTFDMTLAVEPYAWMARFIGRPVVALAPLTADEIVVRARVDAARRQAGRQTARIGDKEGR